MPYDNYDYAAVYTEDLPINGECIGQDVKCLQKTKTTKSGEMIEIEAFPSFLNRKDYSRVKKFNPSTKEQQNLNEKNARKKVIRKINANFKKGDLWGTFGWDNERQPPTEAAAYKEAANFIDRVNYGRKRDKLPNMKYMYTIEAVEGNPAKGEPPVKYHMHIVMDGFYDRDNIELLWNGGEYPQTRRLQIKDFGGLTGLATYIAKNPDGKKRWRQSRGLKKWSKKPSESYSRFSKAKIKKIVEMARNSESMKVLFEREYPGYAYSEQYPCEIKRNDKIGGYYLYCRMYRKRFCEDSPQNKQRR
jgi:hypothetical protein